MESLAAIARDLYAHAPADFTTARNARAKEAADDGDRALATRIRSLGKPSVGAWAVNALVRHRSDEVDALLELGERMRAAQDDLDRDTLRELGRDRQRMLAEIARSARALGDELGTSVSESAAIEVQQTLQAAMGDEAAAAAVRDGTLVRAFSGSGLDPVDLSGAVAVPDSLPTSESPTPTPSGSTPTPDLPQDVASGAFSHHQASSRGAERANGDELEARREARREAKRQAKRDAEDARQDAEAAEAELATLDLRIRDTVEERRERASELRDLKRQVEELQDAVSAADVLAATLRKERAAAQRASDAAARAATRARQRYDKLP